MTALRQRMVEELQRRNYSPATIRGYVLAVKQFAEYFGKPPDRLGATHVQRFQWFLLQERKLTPGTVEMRMSALRFFFKKMLKRRDMHFDDLPFPKTPRKLPTVLSPEEVSCMIDRTTNLMHRTILMVLYGTGVRRTELSLLKVTDIDSKRMVVHIRQGKGSRDRDVPLSPKLLEALREYWRRKKPMIYLFPSTAGQRGVDAPISDKVVWWAVREAARRAGHHDSGLNRVPVSNVVPAPGRALAHAGRCANKSAVKDFAVGVRARGSVGFARSVFVGLTPFPGIFLGLSGATISAPPPGIPRCSSAGAPAADESAARTL